MANAAIPPNPSNPSNQIVYGHPSPVNSATTTPTNNSPTSPRLNHRQLRPPKAPLYVPAALRPTERPQRSSPPTPPRSIHGSDSLDEGDMNEPISRRSTMEDNGISKLAENEWMKHEHLGEVTGHPKRDHWKVRHPLVSPSHQTNTILTFHRPTPPPPTATPQHAAPPSVSSSDGITADTAATFSAPPTQHTSFPLTKMRDSIPRESPLAHATSAGAPSSAGKKPVAIDLI